MTYSTASGALFVLTVSDTDWNFNILQDALVSFNTLDFSAIPAGSPVETLSPIPPPRERRPR